MIRAVATTSPPVRPGRLRRSPALRALVRETRPSPADLVEPVFVAEAPEDAGPIESMPGVSRESIGTVGERARRIADSGVRAVLVFGVPRTRDSRGSSASDPAAVGPRAVEAIKSAAPGLAVISDVCLCQSTDHGHCGVLDPRGEIDLPATLERLADTAVAHARAGADVVAPSAMMDGMVGAIRWALDGEGLEHVGILSYAVKHASAFYGPFRDAARSAPAFGDRRSHQMDPANAREALAEARRDVDEGADAVMVKPGAAALDVVRTLRDAELGRPIAVYQVSGEYAMVRAAAERGWLDERAVAMETLVAMKRAGADIIISYWAERAARWLTEGVDA